MKSVPGAAALALAQFLALTPIASLVLPASPAQAQARHQWRRGEMLPAQVLHAGPNVDYSAQRLRRPPTGYGWFAVDGQVVLASLSSGLILEVVE